MSESIVHPRKDLAVADRIGQRLGNYRLIYLLGRGGFAEVYLGEHIYLKTQVAIKLLQSKLGNEEDLESFLKEARTIAYLEHPNIIRVRDFGVDSQTPFLVMDYAPNGTLRQLYPKGSLLSPPTIVSVVNRIADALQYAHERQMIHQAIKPENMLLGRRYEVLLSDFSIGTFAGDQSPQDYAYMAPEQIRAHASPASDQYTLGVVVYEWLCGDRPFHGSFPEIAMKHSLVPPPPLHEKIPTIPPEVEQVVLTALAKDPGGRFPSVQAFATALEQASQSTTMAPLKEWKKEPREIIHVFFSYARRDQNLRDQLENHLSNLKYRGLITTWNAREISAGEETIQQIDIHLNTAHIILLLISASFLASEYCYSREMMRALQRHERGEAHVIPVLLRPVLFTDAPFAKLQPLPTNRKPVVNWRNRDSAFVDIAVGIERVVRERLALASTSTPQAVSSILGVGPPAPTFQERQAQVQTQQQILPPEVSSRSRRGLIPVGLSLLGLLSVGVLLVQHPNFIPFFGLMVGSLILLAGILLAIRALVKRAQSRAARRREEERTQRQQLEEAQRREQQREQKRQEERRREQEEARRRELEEARRPEQERAYYEKALAAYEQALRQNNADAAAHRGKGNALVGLERYDEALAAFEQALVLTPLPTTYVSVGNVLTTLGRCDEAVAAYEQALALDASYVSAYAGMSKALLQLGRTQEAEQSHEQARQLGDDD